MTDETLIHQTEQVLSDLKSGDETALDRLTALLGDMPRDDKIAVGDISGSTAVAIGSDIRITVRQQTLPDIVVTRLLAIADALDKRAESTFEARGHIRVFLSSPGDVADERRLALKSIARLQNDPLYKERITIEAVAWDKPDDSTPLLASVDPQTAINDGLARPSECDIVVIIMWTRLGTPLDPSRYQKVDGSQYLSGTEWEFEEALAACNKTGRPFVIVYRRSEEPKISLEDPKLAEKITQYQRVKVFFEGFANPDGSIRQGYNSYATPSEFEDIFELHLRKLVARHIEEDHPKSKQAVGIKSVNLVKPVEWPAGVSPFPGLRAFGPDDAPIYFGRGEEADQLVKRLADPDCHCLAVVGASGSGKSSLVAAGLIPRLVDGAIEGSNDWPVIRFSPDEWGKRDPFDSLIGALMSEPFSLPQHGLSTSLRGAPEGLRRVLEEQLASWPKWARILLFIDQFEELFTRVADANLRRDFAAALANAARSPRIKIVLTMRADFYHRMAELPELATLLKEGTNASFPVSAPGPIELYEMITSPARVAGLQFEDGLARQILDDTGDDPGALALMAYALQQLYEESHRDEKLTWSAYQHFGGVQGAIGEQAHDMFESLPAKAQAALPVVFRELVEVDERGTATRKRALLDSLACDDASAELVDALVNARLLVTLGGDFPLVEVAHEALFRSWPKLKAWIDEAQDDLILLRQVRAAADEWARKGQPDYLRWPAERLELIYAMRERLQLPFTEMEQDFIEPEQERLLCELEQLEITHERRRDIGDRLAVIGDIRPGIGILLDGTPDIAWLPVKPGGSIVIEGRAFTVQPFYIAKYLLTYTQFQSFLDAEDGFENDCWWQDFPAEHIRHKMEEQRTKSLNSPRDNISWYQSVAFTRWLSHRMQGLELVNPDSPAAAPLIVGQTANIRLPTEWEWQWVAQCGTEQREYPWGAWLDGYANTGEAGLSRTAAVGMYPHGAAACGALDMAGGLWEWCLNDYDNPQIVDGFGTGKNKALRGGSYYYSKNDAACAYRNKCYPNNRLKHNGLRVVVALL